MVRGSPGRCNRLPAMVRAIVLVPNSQWVTVTYGRRLLNASAPFLEHRHQRPNLMRHSA